MSDEIPNDLHVDMPPEECPNGGVCLTLVPILKRHSTQLERHDEALVRIGRQVDSMGVRDAEREKNNNKLFMLLIALVAITVVHFCAFLLWVGRTGERLDNMQLNDRAQTEAIRQLEKNEHP